MEPHVSGHHATYLEHILKGAVDRGLTVVCGSSQDKESSALCLELESRYEPGRVIPLLGALPTDCALYDSFSANFRREKAFHRFFSHVYDRAAASGPIHRVFVPYLDSCANAIGLFGSPFGATPFDGICMRQTFHFKKIGVTSPRTKADFLKKMLFGRLLSTPSLGRLFTLDPTLWAYCQAGGGKASAKVYYLPDPAEFEGAASRESARAQLGIPEEAKVILVYGHLDERKGIGSLVQHLLNPETPENVQLLLVGVQTPAISDLLSDPLLRTYYADGRIHEINRRVSGLEEQLVFAASDVAWLRYEGFYHTSGVLVKAVQAGLELELPDAGLLGWYKHASEEGDAPDLRTNTWDNALRLIFGGS